MGRDEDRLPPLGYRLAKILHREEASVRSSLEEGARWATNAGFPTQAFLLELLWCDLCEKLGVSDNVKQESSK